MPYSYFYYRSSSYHVSVVNGFSQSIYYSLTLISRHLSMTNSKLFLGRPDLLFCLITCIPNVLFFIMIEDSLVSIDLLLRIGYDLIVCHNVTVLNITFYNFNVGNVKLR